MSDRIRTQRGKRAGAGQLGLVSVAGPVTLKGSFETESQSRHPVSTMDPQILLADLPGSNPGERLRVAIGQAKDGRLTIDLREQHFAEGIGWYDQRTVSLEPSQFKRLQAVLGLKGTSWDEPQAEAPATLPFPGSSVSAPPRRRRRYVEQA